jgi:hypothetical protein
VNPADSPYRLPSVSNGNPIEQELIRRWWHESMKAAGQLVWEYYLEGMYADAVLFLDRTPEGVEQPGRLVAERFPLRGQRVILCEAKVPALTPELIGQAVAYRSVLLSQGARLEAVNIFSITASRRMIIVAREMGLTPNVCEGGWSQANTSTEGTS